jgi:hypothetical protein
LSWLGISQYKIYCTKVNVLSFGTNDKAEEWLRKKNIFFVVSTGRTGTVWLSNLLNTIDMCNVCHEPIPPNASIPHRDVCIRPDSAAGHVNFQKKEIYYRCRKEPDFSTYGEVNGGLRRHVKALSEQIPHAQIVHVVRDGRNVVRSIMSRAVFTDNHPIYKEDFFLPTGEMSPDTFSKLTRFEKICWSWKAENKYMRENTDIRARFEDITTSFELFNAQILVPLGLELDKRVWEQSIGSKNKTGKFIMGLWEDWSQEERDIFERICGEEMTEYGYDIS